MAWHANPPTRRTVPLVLGLLLTMAVVGPWIGCGGSSASTSPEPPPPPPVYSYDPIVGSWEGTVTEERTSNVYRMGITVNRTAAKGSVAAIIIYFLAEKGASSDCTGSLIPETPPANDTYRFNEFIGGPCVPNGEVHLVHRPADGTIDYAWYSQAGVRCCTATLRRRP